MIEKRKAIDLLGDAHRTINRTAKARLLRSVVLDFFQGDGIDIVQSLDSMDEPLVGEIVASCRDCFVCRIVFGRTTVRLVFYVEDALPQTIGSDVSCYWEWPNVSLDADWMYESLRTVFQDRVSDMAYYVPDRLFKRPGDTPIRQVASQKLTGDSDGKPR